MHLLEFFPFDGVFNATERIRIKSSIKNTHSIFKQSSDLSNFYFISFFFIKTFFTLMR